MKVPIGKRIWSCRDFEKRNRTSGQAFMEIVSTENITEKGYVVLRYPRLPDFGHASEGKVYSEAKESMVENATAAGYQIVPM